MKAQKKIFFFSGPATKAKELKIAGNEFWPKKFPPKFWTKEPYFLSNIATNLSKNNDFAKSVHYSIDRSSY